MDKQERFKYKRPFKKIMATGKKALLGLHARMTAMVVGNRLRGAGYAVIEETTVEDTLRRCDEKGPFDIYVVDANLGRGGNEDIVSGQQVYDYLHERGLADRLYVLSNNDDTLRLAREAGMQAYLTVDFTTGTLREIISSGR